MVPAAHGSLAEHAGGLDRLHDWFVAFWEDDPATGEEEWAAYLSGQYVCLRTVDPVRIKQKTERIADATEAVERLRRDPSDPIGRGLLGQAVDGVIAVPGLDALLLPMTAYDRLRFGGPTSRELWVDVPRAEFLTPVAPGLAAAHRAPGPAALRARRRGRLRRRVGLRGVDQPAAQPADEPRRGARDGAPPHRARRRASSSGWPWPPTTARSSATRCSTCRAPGSARARSAGRSCPSTPGAGYATEAARAVLEMAFVHFGLRRVVANLDARNDRSAALCERLGMRREVDKRGDFWSKGTLDQLLRVRPARARSGPPQQA